MLGDFITRILLLLLGYTYPAFECYKTVEKNKVEIEELRFWCQYWILVALITSFERVGDIFISWLPLYGEMKLIFFVYLWYPKTKGTGYVYQTLLRPYISKHETDIDRKIMEMKARAWDFFVYYWQNSAQVGQSTLVQAFQYVLAQSLRLSNNPANKTAVQQNANAPQQELETEPVPQAQPHSGSRPVSKTLSSLWSLEKQPSRGRKWPPPTPPPTPNRAGTDSPRSGAVAADSEDNSILIPDTIPGSPMTEARSRLQRTKVQAAA